MSFKRLWHSFRLCMIREARKRAEYCKKHRIYAYIGDNVNIMPRKVPLYSNLIYLHNNIRITPGVTFVTHDTIHSLLNNIQQEIVNSRYSSDKCSHKFEEKIGCIEIMDNVFIGSGCKILYNTRIGPNAIVAAGSVVAKDVPPNTIVAGVPAKVIGTFDNLCKKRLNQKPYPNGMKPIIGREVSSELAEYVWIEFRKARQDKDN